MRLRVRFPTKPRFEFINAHLYECIEKERRKKHDVGKLTGKSREEEEEEKEEK